MSKKSVRDLLAPSSTPKKTPEVEKPVKRMLIARVKKPAETDRAVEVTQTSVDVTEGSVPVGAPDEMAPSEALEAISEVRLQIDELREVQGEIRARELPKAEKAADLGEVAVRLDDAEAKLARAVEARIHVRDEAPVHRPTPQPLKKRTPTLPGKVGPGKVAPDKPAPKGRLQSK